MPRKPAPKTKVDSIRYQDKRANIPTEELRDFVEDQETTPNHDALPARPLPRPATGLEGQGRTGPCGPRRPGGADLHPGEDPPAGDHRRPAGPGRASGGERASDGDAVYQADLFGDFNGGPADFAQKVEFYQHEQNWTNRMILGDSLLVMTSLAEKEGLKGKVQTIYLDPPYGIKFGSNWQVSTRKRDVKDGKAEDATRQPEQVRAFRDERAGADR